MDQLDCYRERVKDFLTDYATLMNSQPVQDLETVLLFDDEHSQYMLLKVGWPHGRRVRQALLHVAIRNNKIWVEEDLTEESIATYLIQHGVPGEDIVLGFQPPQMRQFTEFATA